MLAGGLALALVIPLSASAQSPRGGRAVVFDGPVVVAEQERLGSLVVFEGPTRVNGTVTGDVVALGGDVDVAGQVGGDVVALSGAVDLEPTARVGGDVRAAQGATAADGAMVSGTIRALEAERAGPLVGILGWLGSWLMMTIAVALLALLLYWLVPQRTKDAAYETARAEPWSSLGVGAVVSFGLPFLAVLAMITVIGIPIGIATLFASVLLAFIGFVICGFMIGRLIAERSARAAGWGDIAKLFVGLAILCALALVPVIGAAVWIVASCLGVGAAVMTAWRTQRPRVTPPQRAPAPPREPEPTREPAPPLQHPAGA
jgi:cytoskeletal protein CcmA (bactofilin family)